MSTVVERAAKRIKTLKVQGARNVAITAIKAIEELTAKSKAQNKTQSVFERVPCDCKELLLVHVSHLVKCHH